MVNEINCITYAVKRIPRSLIQKDKTNFIKWKLEASKAATLNPTYVLPVVDFFNDKYHNYFVYENIENGSLRKFLTQYKPSEKVDSKQVF